MNGINKIRDTIEAVIEVSRDSAVPVLFLANPGLAKSTIVHNWAVRNDYHLETLIGSRFSQEEILGFQVRIEDKDTGEHRLELLEPYWYRNIIEHEKQKIPSLLFLDEISTVQENVQGAMLQLVFDRTIGHNKKLPDSTLVIAAANYKQNIPVFFNIMAPILNRFCLVNLQYESSKAFLDEFLQDENQRVKDIVVYQKTEPTQEKKDALKDGLKKLFTTIFDSFEENKNENGSALDINNQMLNNIYESDTRFVYNFITGRTLYYLYKIMLSFLRFGMTIERHETIMINMVFGLAGLGMNSFGEMQQKTYLKSLETLWKRLYALLQENPTINEKKGVPNLELDFSGKTTAEAVNLWILYNESDVFSKDNEKHLDLLLRHIEKCYGFEKEKVEIVKQSLTAGSDKVFNFVDDMQRLDYLLDVLSKNNDTKIKNGLRRIQEAYKELKEDMLNSMLK